jgi:hypothetical protein
MKKILSALAIGAATLIAYGAAYIPVQGNYIDGSGGTNQIVAGTNPVVSTVINGATNYYNLPNVAYSTNSWPSQVLISPLNTTPWRYIAINVQTLTNLGDKVVFRYAASVDNSHWTSNMFVFSIPASASFANVSTNLDSLGFPFWALQSIENVSASNVVGLIHIPVAKATAP